jgi:hypothetical protein
VTWDGQREELIIASQLQTTDLANFAWVLPIRSSVAPQVEASDISIFKDLTAFFDDQRHPHGNGFGWLGRKEGFDKGVEVVRLAKIDVYDIAVLRAESGDKLVTWLNDNG